KVLLVRKDFILHRKEYTSAIHQVNDRQPVLHSNLLCPEIFFSRDGKPRTRLNGGIIGHDHTQTAFYIAYTRYHPTSRTATILFIHAFTGKQSDFLKWSILIGEVFDSFACRELALLMLAFNLIFTSTK